jgi:hypothetical protein
LLTRRLPVPGQKFVEPVVGRGAGNDALQNIGEPSLWIEPAELGRLCRPPNYAERVGFSPDFWLTGV